MAKKPKQVTVKCWGKIGAGPEGDICFLLGSLLGRGLDSVGIGPADVLWPIAELIDKYHPESRVANLEIRARIVKGDA